ncbi:MAG: hypothetical protein U0X20_26225 [Caldilineaceae bacterium]
MQTYPFGRIQRWLVPAAGVTGVFLALFLSLQAVPAYAQPPDCNGVITQLDGALAPGVCDVLNVGSACLATRAVNATPRTGTIRFTAPGDNAQLNNIRRMITVPKQGAAVLLGGSTANPVKILVFGDTATAPSATQSGSVFTLRASNGQPTCERTRSGLILQTPGGKNGTIVVNGVNIKLGSTAYVVPGADLLFDQDPRVDRREGSRNPDAPLCSGFDSDCDFGDDSCRRTDRLVYGPFCREDAYPYITEGLYRVTLYGHGEVQAGATDYNISHDYQMMGTHRLTLPGSYTFCWDGLQPGGTGFETVVQPRSNGATVDHITLEYLGPDCSLRSANNPQGGTGRGEMGVMSVYNIEGGVDVTMPDGQQASTGSGQRIRVYYQGDRPMAMDEGPIDAPYVTGSDLAQWASGATGGGLPEIQVGSTRPSGGNGSAGGSGSGSELTPPTVALSATVLSDGSYPYALHIEAQAYDPAAGPRNGDGIDHVNFKITGPTGEVILNHDETVPAYCAYGGDSPCEQSISYESYAPGDYRVTATAFAQNGRTASTSASFTLNYGAESTGSTGG